MLQALIEQKMKLRYGELPDFYARFEDRELFEERLEKRKTMTKEEVEKERKKGRKDATKAIKKIRDVWDRRELGVELSGDRAPKRRRSSRNRK